jgi:hypothetical protein
MGGEFANVPSTGGFYFSALNDNRCLIASDEDARDRQSIEHPDRE